ncbi:MAG: AAA family ATPase [Pseudomonadota bacterium]
MSQQQTEFPFSAVTGQADYKLALKLVVVDPVIGGVLVSGPRGTAKSTLARGIIDIAPEQNALVNLPLGASEEMLVGTLDLQKALGEQQVEFNPGLLAKADQGVLYVDEINLLPDNLVDLLLDVAVSGVNHVERDGISHSHAARFVLLGTMNPDEGELRPQLQDRFGLSVQMNHQFSPEQRVEIVRRREQFERDPAAFCAEQQSAQQALRDQLAAARAQLDNVACDDAMRLEIANRCIAAGVDGLRADIIWARAAMANAAIRAADQVETIDLDAVETLVLAHRRNENAPSESQPPSNASGGSGGGSESESSGGSGDWGQMAPVKQVTAPVSRMTLPKDLSAQLTQRTSQGLSYAKSRGSRGQGSAVSRQFGHRLNWFQTLAANCGQWPLRSLRFRRLRRGDPVMHLIMLDTSASTLRNNRLADAKAAILKIAEQAYLDREQLGILGFGNHQVTNLLPRKRAPKALRQLLDDIEAGGGTPLREVLKQAMDYQRRLAISSPDLRLRNYLITDGKSSASLEGIQLQGETVLIDIETSRVKRGRGNQFAAWLGARYLPLPV